MSRHLGRRQRRRDRDARPRLLHPRRRRAAAAVRRARSPARPTRICSSRPTRSALGLAGATITYWLKKPPQKLTLEILDSKGQVVRTFDGARRTQAGRGRGRGARSADGAQRRAGAQVRRARRTRRPAAAPNAMPPADDEEGGGRGGPPTAPMAAGVNTSPGICSTRR